MADKHLHAIMGLRWLLSTYNQGGLAVGAGSDIIIIIQPHAMKKMEKAELRSRTLDKRPSTPDFRGVRKKSSGSKTTFLACSRDTGASYDV